ncbi:HAD-IIA family hydrolase [Conexibacter sp. DBS9H8]|uniref:HAD-IIA family hydrolase n=1 Tax=Conexibacter sp. DBS9H8 TaxID=2937801 RepID=UPI00200F9F71|nr:HAD-IIA family hydrolase [Conexibacter sp. DBS9H8]
MTLSPLLAAYDNVILDLDGTVWVGDRATPRAPEAIAALRGAGKAIGFITNDGTRSPEEYVRKLWSLGCTAAADEVISVGSAVEFHLRGRVPGRGAYIIGAPAVFAHVAAAGHRILNDTAAAEQADVVVLVGHAGCDYAALTIAVRAVLDGAALISGGRDRVFPAPAGPCPGTGALTAAVEYATGASAHSVGKPDPEVFAAALGRLPAGRTLVIGDHLISDLAGAAAAGLDAAIVLTGTATREEAESVTGPAPIAIGTDLATLVLGR